MSPQARRRAGLDGEGAASHSERESAFSYEQAQRCLAAVEADEGGGAGTGLLGALGE